MLADLFGDPDVEICGESSAGTTGSFKFSYDNKTAKVSRPKGKRGPSGFVGLDNQGATCYLNSLIQALYMTPELRQGLYEVDPSALGIDQLEESEKEEAKSKQQKPKDDEIEPDESQLAMLTSMGYSEGLSRAALIAIKNKGIMEAFDWIEANINTYVEPTAAAASNDQSSYQPSSNNQKKKKARLIPLELQRLFCQLQELDQRSISTEELTRRGFNWQSMDGRVQHDAHELNRLLIEALEKSLKHTSGERLCKDLYQGLLAYKTVCQNCFIVSERNEQYYDLNVQVLDCPDLSTAMRQYIQSEILSGDSSYMCDVCASKQTAHRAATIKEIPKVLTFSCNRFKCNRDTNWERVKIVDSYKFPLYLDMSVYDSNSDLSGAVPCSDSADEASILQFVRQKHVWIDQVYNAAISCAQQLIDKYGIAVTVDHLSEQEILSIGEALCAPTHVLMKENTGSNPNLYSLFAIIIHRGTAYNGHYYAYIKDILGQGKYELSEEAFKDPPKPPTTSAPSQSSSNSMTGVGDTPLYLIQRDDKTKQVLHAFIDESTPLAVLVGLFTSMNDSEFEGSSAGGNSSKRSSRSQSNAKASTESAKKQLTLSISTLNKLIKSNLGSTWNSEYKTKYGTLNDFIKQQVDIFLINGQLVTMCVSKTSVSILPSEEFAGLCQASATSVSQSSTNAVAVESKASSTASPDDAMDVSTSKFSEEALLQYQRDEELAKELSKSFATEVNANNQINVPKSEESTGEWQTTTSRKKRSNANNSNAQNSSVVSSTTSEMPEEQSSVPAVVEVEPESDPDLPKRVAVRKLAQSLCTKFHGNFYEFNDSEVTPIPFHFLNKPSEGHNTAYLLVYRKLSSASDAVEVAVINSSGSTLVVPNPPVYWRLKSDEINANLIQQRSDFELQSHLITLRILCPKQVSVDYPLLLPIASPANSSDSSRSSIGSSGAIQYIEFEFDLRESMQSNLDRFLIANSDKLLELGLAAKGKAATPTETIADPSPAKPKKGSNASNSNSKKVGKSSTIQPEVDSAPVLLQNLQFSELVPLGEGFYPGTLIDNSLVAIDAINRGYYYLLWNGSECNGAHLAVGAEAMPVQLSLSLLCPNTNSKPGSTGSSKASKKGKSNALPPAPIVFSKIDSFWVPKNTSVSECCRLAANKCGMEVSNCVVHVADKKMGPVKSSSAVSGGSDSDSLMGATRSSDKYFQKNQVKELTAVLLWCGAGSATSNGVVTFHQPSSSSSSNTSKAVQATSNSMTVSDLIDENVGYFYGTELLIEDIEARGMHPKSLAEAEIAHRNATIDVNIDINFDIVDYFSKLLSKDRAVAMTSAASDDDMIVDMFQEATNLASSSSAQSVVPMVPKELQIQIERDCTGALLKQKIFEQMNGRLSEELTYELFGSHTRLRIGEDVIDDEYCALCDLRVKHNSTIYLDIGKVVTAGATTILIKACLVLPAASSTSASSSACTATATGTQLEAVTRNSGNLSNCESKGAAVDAAAALETVSSAIRATETQSNASKGKGCVGTTRSEPIEVEINVNATVRELRDKLGCVLLGLEAGWTAADAENCIQTQIYRGLANDPFAYRLRRTNFLSETEDIVTEVNDKGNLISLDSAKLLSGNVVLLEPGRGPIKNLSKLKVFLWIPTPIDSFVDPEISAVAAAAGQAISASAAPTTTSTAEADASHDVLVYQSLQAFEKLRTKKANNCLHRLGVIHTLDSKTLTDLQACAYELFQECVSQCQSTSSANIVFEGATSTSDSIVQLEVLNSRLVEYLQSIDLSTIDANHLLMRELKSELLPGRVYWSCDHKAASKSKSDDITSLVKSIGTKQSGNQQQQQQVSGAATAVCTNSTGTTTLKKLNLVGEKNIIIEILPKEQRVARPATGAFKIWVQYLHNPEIKDEDTSTMSPHWPPLQATVDGGSSPTFGHLLNSVSTALTAAAITIPSSYLIFKFLPGTYTWTQLVAGAGAGGGKKKLDNICSKPYEMKEGDLICVCDEKLLSVPLSSDHKYESVKVCRLEDRLFQLLAAERKKKKRSNKRSNEDFSYLNDSNPTGSTRKRSNIIEQALSIGGDLDFSDDDDGAGMTIDDLDGSNSDVMSIA